MPSPGFREQCASPSTCPPHGRNKVINVFEHDGNDAAGNETDSPVNEAHQGIVEQVIELDEDFTPIPREGRGLRPAEAARRVREGHRGRPPRPHLLLFRKERRGVPTTCSTLRQPLPQPHRGEPTRVPEARGARPSSRGTASPAAKPTRAAPSPTSSRSSPTRSWGSSAFPLSTRARNAKAEGSSTTTRSRQVGHLFMLQGKDHVEVHEVGPGAIGAVAKIDEIKFNGVLHDSHELTLSTSCRCPSPSPCTDWPSSSRTTPTKPSSPTPPTSYMAEDPCLLSNASPRPTRPSCAAGRLHLPIIIEHSRTSYGIDLITSPPKVAYKETITTRAEGHHRHKKQTGGAGQFGEVYLGSSRCPPTTPRASSSSTTPVGGSIPAIHARRREGHPPGPAEGTSPDTRMTGCASRLRRQVPRRGQQGNRVHHRRAKAFIDAVQKAKPG